MKIKLIFIVSSSPLDTNGNRYHYTRMIDTKTGHSVTFTSEEKVYLSILRQLGICFDDAVVVQRIIGKKQLFRESKTMPFGLPNDFITLYYRYKFVKIFENNISKNL